MANAEIGPPEMQGLASDPDSTVPVIEYEGLTVAVYDVVWRSGVGDGTGNVRGYSSQTLIINRIEVEDEHHTRPSYKAYFVYSVANGTDKLTNEYNCKASHDETHFFDFTFLRKGDHEHMEKPRFYSQDRPILDDDGNPFLGLCMVIRQAVERVVIVGAWAKFRSSRTGDKAVLSDEEWKKLCDPDGLAKSIQHQELFKRWF